MSRIAFRLLAASFMPTALAGASDASALSDDQRRADLHHLVEQIRTVHPDPFHHTPEPRFDEAVTALESRLGALTDVETIVEFQRLVALLADGHSSVWLRSAGAPFDRQYPVVIYPFDDGTYVAGADSAYRHVVGGRVVRIGEVAAEEALGRVRDVISGENAFTTLDRIPNMLTIPPVLHALGISPHAARLELEVAFPDGSTERATLSPVAAERFGFVGPEIVSPGAVSARDVAAPLQFRDPERHYWFEHLPGEALLYVQFNRVHNAPDESLRAFFERVFAFADAHEVERFVLDIRYNHGGNNQLLLPLVHGLIRRVDTINRPGHFFTILGRGTFSAAVSCTALLEAHTNVRFAGEPAGSAPIHFGDAREIVLPESGAVVSISAWRWQTRLPWDDRVWFAPSIAAPSTFADYAAGRDGPLEAIRAAAHTPSLGELLHTTITGEGVEAGRAAYAEYRTEHPDRWGVTTESEVNALGYRLLGEGAVDEAIAVFTLNTESYPESANAWDSLAEGHLEAGDRERAMALYRKALEVDPEFHNARRMLADLTDGRARGHH